MSTDTQWLWAAHGKHPSAKDFFSVGRGFPLASVFTDWIKRGYPALAVREKQAFRRYSWRFWARGSGKGELACGLLRDSHDSFGRPYPLLIIGTGPLPSWEEHWDLLPSVCERVWCRIESVSARAFSALGEFEEEIGKIRPPEPSWSDPGHLPELANGEKSASGDLLTAMETLAEETGRLSAEDMGRISLGSDGSFDSHILIMHLSSLLKRNLGMAPSTLFIGGTNDESSMVFFRRPMRQSDFPALWGGHAGSD